MLRSLFKPDAKLGSLHPSGSFNDFSLGYENVVEQIGEETTGSSLNVLTSGSSRRAPKNDEGAPRSPTSPTKPYVWQEVFNPGRNFNTSTRYGPRSDNPDVGPDQQKPLSIWEEFNRSKESSSTFGERRSSSGSQASTDSSA